MIRLKKDCFGDRSISGTVGWGFRAVTKSMKEGDKKVKNNRFLFLLLTSAIVLMPFGLTACGGRTASTPESALSTNGESTCESVGSTSYIETTVASTGETNTTSGSGTTTRAATVTATASGNRTTTIRNQVATTKNRTTTAKTTATTMPSVPASAKFSLKPGHQYVGHVKTLLKYNIYDRHSIVQGGTFDGTYYYVAMINNQADPETTYLFKFDSHGNLVRKSPKLMLDHANDITYVKKWNALLVSHCQSSDGHYYRYSLVNPDTFAIIKTEDLPNPFFGMDYCEQRDSFVSARWGGDTIDLWNGDLTPQQAFQVETPPGTSQGVAADANYLYFARYNPNTVQVYDWDGNLSFSIPLDMEGEPEHISIIDGIMYIGGNNMYWTGGYFSYVELEDVTGK